MQIGVDIIDLERVEKLLKFEKGLNDIFTKNELEHVSTYSTVKKVESLAGRFASKEATVKALGTGFTDDIKPIDIEILNLESGQPSLKLYGNAFKCAMNLGLKEFKVTISHNKNTAVSFVVLH